MKEQLKNKKIVYCYVVGDIIHIGHLRALENAAKQGDYLVVGVLTDEATMEKKPKPIISFEERVATVRALKCVDRVVAQETYSPLDNIMKLKPDVLMESDSHPNQPANSYVNGYGGKVVITPYYKLQSSTKIKQKVKKSWDMKNAKLDSKKVSFIKSLIWRILGVGILASIVYIFTRQLVVTTYITLVHHLTFILVYYLHERVWFKIKAIQGRTRTVLKSLVYEIVLGMGIGGFIVLMFTGEWSKVSQITLTYTAVKIITYIIFEYIWKKARKQ